MNGTRTNGLTAAAAALILSLTSCGGPSAAQDTNPDTFTAKITLKNRTDADWPNGTVCDGPRVGDLQKNFVLNIRAHGALVASGKLGYGKIDSTDGTFCVFNSTLPSVPAGLPVYTVDLGDRYGHRSFTEASLREGAVSLVEEFERAE